MDTTDDKGATAGPKKCIICNESAEAKGFGPWRRLKEGSILGPACFKRVEDKYNNGELMPGARYDDVGQVL